MEFLCPYCRGSGKFRHERPNVSDRFWVQMTSGKFGCPLCHGKGKLYRPISSPILDTGLLFVRTQDSRILVGCPDAGCSKWVDCTEFFEERKKYETKCPDGHDIVLEVQPSWGRKS